MKYGFVNTIGDLKRMIANLDNNMPVLMRKQPDLNFNHEYKTNLIPTVQGMKKEIREFPDSFDNSLVYEEIFTNDPDGQECFILF